MGLSQEAHEWNEQQKRYREIAHQHKHMGGADHKEMMTVLSKIELSLGVLIDTIKEWIEGEDKRREDEHRRETYGMTTPYPYRTPRSDPDSEPPPYQQSYTPTPTKTVPSTRKGHLRDEENKTNREFGDGVDDGRGGS